MHNSTAKLAYAIDLVFLLIAPLHPALIMLAVVQYVVRRSAWLCAGLLALFGQMEVTPLALILLPGAVAYLPDEDGNEPTTRNAPLQPLQSIATPNNADQQRSATPVTTPDQVAVQTPQLDRTTAAVYEDGQLAALLALILESKRKPFQNGEVAETRAIECVFGVTRSSQANSEYQRLRARLKAELDRRNAPQPDAILGFTPDNRTIRQDSAGRVYIVGADGSRAEMTIGATP